MRFKDYLIESMDGSKDIIEMIEKDCKPFIDDWKKLNTSMLLLSGRYKGTKYIEKRTIRDNRKPKDTPLDVHSWLDEWFYKKFGVKARSNSIFASFDWDTASEYGRGTYIIFPIGKYKAISSYYSSDLYDDVVRVVRYELGNSFSIRHQWNSGIISKQTKEKIKDDIFKMLDRKKFDDKLLKHISEIMISCKEYYVINTSYKDDIVNYLKGHK